jgi:cobalt/nickel transport protein
VLVQGKPVPNADIEVEYLNDSPDRHITPPSEPFITQTIRSDSSGVFSYAMPRAGWWGFAALRDAKWTLKKEGKPRKVEIGAVYWVRTEEMK